MRTQFIIVLAIIVLASTTLVVLAAPPAGSGTITGKVTYTGTPVKMKPIDMSKEPVCAKEHNPPGKTQTVATGPENSLEYVVVYISAGDQGSAAASHAAEYDQKGCMYTPHVLPLQVNQQLLIKNNDPVAHNIHPMPKANSEWNKSQPPGTPPIDTKWDKPEFIAVKCNIHPWMHGYFVVLNTSHYGITDENGNFTIKDVPPGKYTITAWQESYGTQSQEVTVGGGGAKANFVYKALPY